MIGAAFVVTLASAQAGDEAAFACIFRDVQPARPDPEPGQAKPGPRGW